MRKRVVSVLVALALIISAVVGVFFVGGSPAAQARSLKPLTGCAGGTFVGEDITGNGVLSYNGYTVNVNVRLNALEDSNSAFCGVVYTRVMWECDNCSGKSNAPTIESILWMGSFTNPTQLEYANNGTASHSNGDWHNLDTPMYNNCNNITVWGQARIAQNHSQIKATNQFTANDPFC